MPNIFVPTIRNLFISCDVDEFIIPAFLECLRFTKQCNVLKGDKNCNLKHLSGRFKKLPPVLLNVETFSTDNFNCLMPKLKEVWCCEEVTKIYPARVRIFKHAIDRKHKRSKNTFKSYNSGVALYVKDVSYNVTYKTKNTFMLKVYEWCDNNVP